MSSTSTSQTYLASQALKQRAKTEQPITEGLNSIVKEIHVNNSQLGRTLACEHRQAAFNQPADHLAPAARPGSGAVPLPALLLEPAAEL